jgi:hypothetical protein
MLSGFLLVGLLVSGNAGGNDAPGDDPLPWLSTGWLLFGDLYHIPSHHLPAGDGATGVVLRRGYLTFDADWNGPWFGRLRFELNQSGEFETYDFEADFKDLYVGRPIGRHELILGLAPTLTFDVVESSWAKRYLMRTPLDLQGEPSRDTGVLLKGPLSADGSWSYRAKIGSGAEFGTESGDGRKFMFALNKRFETRSGGHWMVDVYADHERLSGPRDRNTLQGFVEYGKDAWHAGLLYSNQDRQEDPPLEVASAWWVGRLGAGTELIARVDRVIQPSPRGDNISYIPFDPSAPATMFLTGLEFDFGDHFRLTPNVIVTAYDRNDAGVRPETDVYLRLTAFVDFE